MAVSEVSATLRVRFDSAYHLRASAATVGLIDGHLLRRPGSAGGLVIPGSTLKGRIRDQVERVWRALGGCEAHDTQCPCAICLMFGAPDNRPGRLRFYDALPTAGTGSTTSLRTRVAIDGERRTARAHHLFTTEVGAAAEFQSQIRGHLPEARAKGCMALLAVGIRLVRTIGAGKSQGLGWVYLELDPVVVAGQRMGPWELREAWEGGVVSA